MRGRIVVAALVCATAVGGCQTFLAFDEPRIIEVFPEGGLVDGSTLPGPGPGNGVTLGDGWTCPVGALVCETFDKPDEAVPFQYLSVHPENSGNASFSLDSFASRSRALKLSWNGKGTLARASYERWVDFLGEAPRFRVDFAILGAKLPAQDSKPDAFAIVILGENHFVSLLGEPEAIYAQELVSGEQKHAEPKAGPPLSPTTWRRIQMDFILDGIDPHVVMTFDALSPTRLNIDLLTLEVPSVIGILLGVSYFEGVSPLPPIDVVIDDVAVSKL